MLEKATADDVIALQAYTIRNMSIGICQISTAQLRFSVSKRLQYVFFYYGNKRCSRLLQAFTMFLKLHQRVKCLCMNSLPEFLNLMKV